MLFCQAEFFGWRIIASANQISVWSAFRFEAAREREDFSALSVIAL
ncbi:hypothetical protein SAMCFNEI73_pC1559 (plasmid) [Sinorhizobium americanum]|uniref:Uncharacterized protein n=1 Tax=Sinorhizobium americanum TaxID=194963 RepID=A0A1L3LZ21_9HYPH|nr:hypothetical protein SAMCFNEI73_pC1559 [Sinorhizobium americanum]